MKSVALEVVRYDTQTGLVPVVVQDRESLAVLMQAYANREALKRTMATGEAWFWSRSRQSYWHKGETSGNRQLVREIRVDCDGDSVLYLVDSLGPACHTGETTCFFQSVSENSSDGTRTRLAADSNSTSLEDELESGQGLRTGLSDVGPTVLSASGKVLPGVSASDHTEFHPEFLATLWSIVESRYLDRPAGSYTTYLFEQGVDKAAKKLGEEAVEVVIAAKNAAAMNEHGKAELAAESADLLFHLMVIWKAAGLNPDAVLDVLNERHNG